MSKYTIPFERCWVVRSPEAPKHSHQKRSRPLFWVVANEWNGSPAHATIFPTEEAAQRQIDDARHYKRVGFGPDCVVEAVPLEGALKTLGTVITADEVRRRLRDE